MSKKKLVTTLLIPGSIVLPMLVLFAFRTPLAEWKLEKMLHHTGLENTEVHINGLSIEGIREFTIREMEIIPSKGEKLKLENALIETVQFPGNLGELKVKSIQIDRISVDLSDQEVPEGSQKTLPDPASLVRKAVKSLGVITAIQPEQISILNAELETHGFQVQAEDISLENEQWNGWITLQKGSFIDLYRLSGNPDLKKGSLDFTLERNSHQIDRSMPGRSEDRIYFDRFEVNTWFADGKPAQAGLLFLVEGLKVQHPMLADSQLVFPDLAGDISLVDIPSGSLIGPGSLLLAGDLALIPQLVEDSLVGTSLALVIPEQEAEKWMEALPENAFSTLKEMQWSGKCGMMLSADFDPKDPLSLDAFVQMENRDLRIMDFGQSGLDKLDKAVSYHPFGSKGGERVTGVKGADFVSLDELPALMKAVVVKAEDPAFFQHFGIDNRGLSIAIRENILDQGFIRGGSTISMQLTRNLFLEQEKTICRKAEEILLTSVIEEKQLASKERILELYMNVVEWGPGIYGIGNASKFYFEKAPSELNLDQMVFLASILPNPQQYETMLDRHGRPLNFAADNMNSSKFLLLMDEKISEEEFNENIELDLSGHILTALQGAGSEAQGPQI